MKKIKVPYLDKEIKIDADEEFALRAMADGGCIIPVSDLVKGHGNWEKSVWSTYGYFKQWSKKELKEKLDAISTYIEKVSIPYGEKGHVASYVAEELYPDLEESWLGSVDREYQEPFLVKILTWFESHPRRQVVVTANPFVVHSILSLIDKE